MLNFNAKDKVMVADIKIYMGQEIIINQSHIFKIQNINN